MLLYGAGGHAKVVCSCLEANKILINGIFDDNPDIREFNKIKFLGVYNQAYEPNDYILLTIGDNRMREKIAQVISHRPGSVIHPTAIIDKETDITKGTVIFHGAIIQRDVTIGNHVIINTGASIDHDCHIHDFSHIAPKATLCGNVDIGYGTLVGAGSIIHPGIKIGEWCTIGIGTTVMRDVPDFSVVIGNPGRILKKR